MDLGSRGATFIKSTTTCTPQPQGHRRGSTVHDDPHTPSRLVLVSLSSKVLCTEQGWQDRSAQSLFGGASQLKPVPRLCSCWGMTSATSSSGMLKATAAAHGWQHGPARRPCERRRLVFSMELLLLIGSSGDVTILLPRPPLPLSSSGMLNAAAAAAGSQHGPASCSLERARLVFSLKLSLFLGSSRNVTISLPRPSPHSHSHPHPPHTPLPPTSTPTPALAPSSTSTSHAAKKKGLSPGRRGTTLITSLPVTWKAGIEALASPAL